MGLDTADFIVIAVLVGAGCIISSAGLWVALRQAASVSQRATENRLDELTTALKALEAKVAELSKVQEKPAPAAVAEAKAPVVEAPPAAQKADEEVTPETLVMIAAAVTAFLGKKVRIRSAKLMRPRETVSAWSQHGRALVHSSHNPRA